MKSHTYKPGVRMKTSGAPREFQAALLVLCVFFIVGAGLGRLGHSYVTAGDNEELARYICSYADLVSGSKNTAADICSVVLLYFRYPLFYFFLGFLSVGALLIPFTCAVQGFFLSFSISCFASSLGKSGVLLALSAFGIRCLFMLPCCFLLAAWSFLSAKDRISRTGTGAGRNSVSAGSFWRFAICVIVLLVGSVLELSVVPRLFSLALAKI